MGRGSRHSKNAGVMGGEALSYAERKALGFGTVKERLGKVGPQSCRAALAALHYAVVRPKLQTRLQLCGHTHSLPHCRTPLGTTTTAA